MQCPTCGTNTPGTLGTCPNCNAPIDQPGGPLGASPAPDSSFGEQTMVVPPATPSWTIDLPQDPSMPPLGGGGPEPSGAPEVPGGPSESTAPWAFDPNEQSGGFETAPPPPPSWGASEQPSGNGFVNNSPAPPSGNGFQNDPLGAPPLGGSPLGIGDVPEAPAESIVPESWYARPRKPASQVEQDPGVQQWAPQPQASDPGFGTGNGAYGPATVLDGGYPGGGATQLDHAPMNMGAPMGPMDSPLGPPMGPQGPHAPMGYDQGMPGYPPPPHTNKASKPLLIAVSALVTVAVLSVGLVLWPGGDDEPPTARSTPTPSQNTPVARKEPISPARQQAARMNALLNTSAAARRELAGALNGTAKCETLPAAIRGFQGVAQRRTNQMQHAKRLRVDKLRNGPRMKLTLYQAFRASLEADQRLLAWANKAKQKCRGKPRPDVGKAPGRISAERRATIAKKQFVAMWNPVARATGQQPRQWNGL